jgi:hypothetical protein
MSPVGATDQPIAQFRSHSGILVIVGLSSLLFLGIGLLSAWIGVATWRDEPDKQTFGIAACLLALIVFLVGSWFLWETYGRWGEELTVYPSGLIRRRGKGAESLPWECVSDVDVEEGSWMLEWLLLQVGLSLPRLTISTTDHGTWVFRANMGQIEQMCQTVLSIWTAYRAGMR